MSEINFMIKNDSKISQFSCKTWDISEGTLMKMFGIFQITDGQFDFSLVKV